MIRLPDCLSYPGIIRWFLFLELVPPSEENQVHFWKHKFQGIWQLFLRWGHGHQGILQAAQDHASLSVSSSKIFEFDELRMSWDEINQFPIKQCRDNSQFPAANLLNPSSEIIPNDFCSIQKARWTAPQWLSNRSNHCPKKSWSEYDRISSCPIPVEPRKNELPDSLKLVLPDLQTFHATKVPKFQKLISQQQSGVDKRRMADRIAVNFLYTLVYKYFLCDQHRQPRVRAYALDKMGSHFAPK